MRSNLHPTDFFLKMKRKPRQQKLLDNISNLTNDEIDSCGEPLWIRDVLKELKLRNGKSKSKTIEELADQMSVVKTEIETFPCYIWTSGPFEIKPSRGFSLEINRNDKILCDLRRSCIKVNDTLLLVTNDQINQIMNSSEFYAMLNELEFIDYYKGII